MGNHRNFLKQTPYFPPPKPSKGFHLSTKGPALNVAPKDSRKFDLIIDDVFVGYARSVCKPRQTHPAGEMALG